MPTLPSIFPFSNAINSVELHYQRLDDKRQHRTKRDIVDRILKVLNSPYSKPDLLYTTLKSIEEFCSVSDNIKRDLVTDGLCKSLLYSLQISVKNDQKISIKYILRCVFRLMWLDDSSTYPASIFQAFVDESLFDNVLKIHELYQKEPSIVKPLGYIVRFMSEKGYIPDFMPSSVTTYVEDIAMCLLRKRTTVVDLYNYSRGIAFLYDAVKRMSDVVTPALKRILHESGPIIKSGSSNRVFCTLMIFHVWTPKHLPSGLDPNQLCVRAVHALSANLGNTEVVAAAALGLTAALRPYIPHGDASESCIVRKSCRKLQRFLLSSTPIPDILIKAIYRHHGCYRVLITLLECFHALFNSGPCSDPTSYHTIKSTGTVNNKEFDKEKDGEYYEGRCARLLRHWGSFIHTACLNARWGRRKAFCLFLACCCPSSCINRSSMLNDDNGKEFPPLSLIFNHIAPVDDNTSPVHAVFFRRGCAPL